MITILALLPIAMLILAIWCERKETGVWPESLKFLVGKAPNVVDRLYMAGMVLFAIPKAFERSTELGDTWTFLWFLMAVAVIVLAIGWNKMAKVWRNVFIGLVHVLPLIWAILVGKWVILLIGGVIAVGLAVWDHLRIVKSWRCVRNMDGLTIKDRLMYSNAVLILQAAEMVVITSIILGL